ncbi:N-acetylglucosamine-6-phosphate deacetylase [Aerococcus viridans]|uniref:N-acetylglucosamine-6-phosphate deacetylase n=1 Tax=Aerococcus urinaeequi TaxID=51665 RepID=UPI003AAD0247
MISVLYADKFFIENGVKGPGYLTIKEGKFGSYSVAKPNQYDEILDFTGSWIAPGLVDTHIHGYKGHDVMDNDFEGLNEISEGLLSCGVTSFLPTTLTSSIELLDGVSKMIGQKAKDVKGAKIRGIFFEGPFFTEEHKGAQNPDYFIDPSVEHLKKWQELSGGLIKKIAIAPEREGALEFIDYAKKENITVALAHSSATYDKAKQAVDHGASIFTHTYNGMSGFHHREPGMVGAAMNLKDVYVELICDGYHVNPVAANILMDVSGRERVVLVTDCMRAGGMPEGNSKLGEFPVLVKDGAARLENGSLAGSILELKTAVKNVVAWDIATSEEAIKMASTVPAASVNIENECGKIQEGLDADFIVLSPELDLNASYIDGECRYSAE